MLIPFSCFPLSTPAYVFLLCCLCARHLGGVRPMMLNSCQTYVEAGKVPLQQTRPPQLNLTRPRLCLPTQPKDTNKMWTHHQHSPSHSGNIRTSAQELQSLSRQTAGRRSELPPLPEFQTPPMQNTPAQKKFSGNQKRSKLRLLSWCIVKLSQKPQNKNIHHQACAHLHHTNYTPRTYTPPNFENSWCIFLIHQNQ